MPERTSTPDGLEGGSATGEERHETEWEQAWEEPGEDSWEQSWEEPWEGAWVDDLASDPDEFVALPREGTRMRRVMWVLGVLLLVVGLAGAGAAAWISRQLNPPGEPGEELALEVREGSTVTDVAEDLAEAGVITNSSVFRLYSRWKGFDEVQAGLYEHLRLRSSMGDVIALLEAGPVAPPPAALVTIPEGLRLSEVIKRLTETMPEFDEDELAVALTQIDSRYRPPGTQSLEGFLFPETYRIEDGDEDDELKLLEQMIGQFDEVATELGYGEVSPERAYELMIIASIVEREARVDEDFGKVSRVIHNRLEAGMPLEVDATLLYAIGHKETLTESELQTDTPYNTRLYPGLPPTPIAMPGRGALQAAIEPVEGPWLYYVLADEDGSHFFTDDYEEFLRVAAESREKGLFE